MYFFYGVKYYILYPNRSWTLAHACIGVIPLILSLSQISKAIREKSLRIHRHVGRLLVLCSILQIPTTVYLSINWPKKEIVDVMRGALIGFAFLWGVWGIAVLYYVTWNRNIDLHRQWAIRFAVVSHFIPIFGRFFVLLVWAFCGRPLDEEGRIKTLQAAIWTLTALFVPFQEFFVWLESGSCWFHSLNISRTDETGQMNMVTDPKQTPPNNL